eukprot:TRINITY_DN33021_c0_g1_i1.p1 TRINITY_DN33021_c0_g1~~TRINITY_DN33021_c0_g1_i1.p1  ORF type:complete len:194 (-),score=53.73 TRINITY_DN33021_c0_g1_i1:58-606(-)
MAFLVCCGSQTPAKVIFCDGAEETLEATSLPALDADERRSEPGYAAAAVRHAEAEEADEAAAAATAAEAAAAAAAAVAVVQADSAEEIPLTVRLQNTTWRKSSGGRTMGKISGGVLLWHPSFNMKQSKMTFEEPDQIEILIPSRYGEPAQAFKGTVHVQLDGNECTSITWSDGDIWLRISED